MASRLGPKPQRRNLPTAGLATAIWLNAHWDALQPETAAAASWTTRKACRTSGPSGSAPRLKSDRDAAHEAPPVALVGPASRAGAARAARASADRADARGVRRSPASRDNALAPRRPDRGAAEARAPRIRRRCPRGEAEPIADAHAMRRLHALGIQMDFAAVDRRGRERARFVKSGMPQPLVQAVTIAFVRRVSR